MFNYKIIPIAAFAFQYCKNEWIPNLHRVSRAQVSDGGDGLHMWRVAENKLNKQSRSRQGVVLQLGGWARG
jgi:hypothetical protein